MVRQRTRCFLLGTLLIAIFLPGLASGQDVSATDPTDPTKVQRFIDFEWEYSQLANGGGSQWNWHWNLYQPLTEDILLNVDASLPAQSNMRDLGQPNRGIGDTRLRLFWLISTGHPVIRAIAPSIDAIAPTGDQKKGLGTGSWIIMPNLVLAIKMGEYLDIYPFFRYVHSDPDPPFMPSAVSEAIDLPPASGSKSDLKIRGFNLETLVNMRFENSIIDWIDFTPNYFVNFAGDRGYSFELKVTPAKMLSDSMYLKFEFVMPISGQKSNDYTIKPVLGLFF